MCRSALDSIIIAATLIFLSACADHSVDRDVRSRLAEWRKGVWISGEATYTIYTDSHYFVISFEGDTAAPNLYVGASQIAFHEKGIARRQLVRLRQYPGMSLTSFRDVNFAADNEEPPLHFDTALFVPGTCNIKDGVIYDAVTETTDTSILLSTCNGDREIIYSNGISAYLPAEGGQFYSFRVERIHIQ
jgi:hypothetical protein